MSLFTEIVAAGIPYSNHESDLYVLDCPEARRILNRYQEHAKNAQPFANQRPPHQGEAWLDIPFAYDPWWSAKIPKTRWALVQGSSDTEIKETSTGLTVAVLCGSSPEALNLILAAPEMKAALEALLEWEKLMGGWEGDVWKKAKAALASATEVPRA